MKFVIVTGLSGAGKTQAIRSLEDLGYFCVDNLPTTLIPKFAEACFQTQGKINKVALVIDIRGGEFFDTLFKSLNYLKEQGHKYQIVFLEASDEVLIKRYKETRRKHPLSPEGRIIDGIRKERKKLSYLRSKADYIINTTKLSSKQLRDKMTIIYGEEGQLETKLIITILSFGFKYGIPMDSDLVFDVRFLPNPYYIDELKHFSGIDKEVRDYVLKFKEANIFLNKLKDLLEFLIPYYIKEGKRQLIISIGCTGGRHRSVTIANSIYEMLKAKNLNVSISHRDINEDVTKGGFKI